MRRMIHALTARLKSLTDDEVIRLSRAAEFERLASSASDHWFAVLEALRPRLSFLKPARAPSLSRQFFQPVSDLLVDGRSGAKTPGEIDRASLKLIWAWLLESDAAVAIQSARLELRKAGPDPQDAKTELILLPVRQAAIQAMFGALRDRAASTMGRSSQSSLFVDPSVLGDFREIALSLTVAEHLIALQARIPSSLDIVTTGEIEVAREYFHLIEAVNPDLSYFVPMIYFRRLTRPWEVLRLTAAVSGLSSESKLARPDFKIIFDNLVDRLRGELKAFDETDNDNAQKLLSHLRTFSDIYMGISETTSIQKKSRLGKVLLECRNEFSAQIAARVRSVSASICQAIPLDYSNVSVSAGPLSPLGLAQTSERVAVMADFIGNVSRLSCMTDLYFGIDKDVKQLNNELDKRLVALTQAYRQKFSVPPEILNQHYDILAPAIRRLSGSDSEARLAAVRV